MLYGKCLVLIFFVCFFQKPSVGCYALGRTIQEMVENGLLESRELSSACDSYYVEVCQVESYKHPHHLNNNLLHIRIAPGQQVVRENRNSSRTLRRQGICILSKGKLIH